jgi:8-oxo-dGTP pyrophosphatase MutT (NUDIX family)
VIRRGAGHCVEGRSRSGAASILGSQRKPKFSSSRSLRQVSALPYTVGPDRTVQVLLITTRDKHHWIIPRGWPMDRFSRPAAAAQEAYEEAGVGGLVWRTPIGTYRYLKGRHSHSEAIEVEVYPLEVTDQLESWLEQNQRQPGWFSLAEAMQMVRDEGAQESVIPCDSVPHARAGRAARPCGVGPAASLDGNVANVLGIESFALGLLGVPSRPR